METSGRLGATLFTIKVLLSAVVMALTTTLFSLFIWTVLPFAAGWSPSVVMTGSMEPAIAPGDIVVTAPLEPRALQFGYVIRFKDPSNTHPYLMHRIIELNEDGTFTTKGDANQSADSTPVPPENVTGVARLRVPLIGLPAVWMRNGQFLQLGLALLAVALVARVLTGLPALIKSGEGGTTGDPTPDPAKPAPAADEPDDPEPTDTQPTETEPPDAQPPDAQPPETELTELTEPEVEAEAQPALPEPAQPAPTEVELADALSAELEISEPAPAELDPADIETSETKPAEPEPPATEATAEQATAEEATAEEAGAEEAGAEQTDAEQADAGPAEPDVAEQELAGTEPVESELVGAGVAAVASSQAGGLRGWVRRRVGAGLDRGAARRARSVPDSPHD